MKEIPILFSTPMVQAILEGRKTMTRRIVKDIHSESQYLPEFKLSGFTFIEPDQFEKPHNEKIASVISCRYGQPGDVLWVREAWCLDLLNRNVYKADRETDGVGRKFSFSPSIHMPKAAARIWLQVESIRVERLNEIHYQDAIAEGIERFGDDSWKDYQSKTGETYYSNPRLSFKSLFLSINGKPKPVRERGETGKILSYTAIAWDQEDYEKTWKKFYGVYRNKPLHVIINPWVWVVKFKVLSTTGKANLKP